MSEKPRSPSRERAREERQLSLEEGKNTQSAEYQLVHHQEDLLAITGHENIETLQERIEELRGALDEMDFLGSGKNWIGLEKAGGTWSQLILAPKSDFHKEELRRLLAGIGIYAWEEYDENVEVLVVEHPRDLQILRMTGLIVYLLDTPVREKQEAERIEQERRRSEHEERERVQKEQQEHIDAQVREIERTDAQWRDRQLKKAEIHEKRMQRAYGDVEAARAQAQQEFSVPVPAQYGADAFFQFPYPHLVLPKEVRSFRRRNEVKDSDTEESIDEDLKEIITKWDKGIVDEVRTEEVASSQMPTLTLFSVKKYKWGREDGKKVLKEVNAAGEVARVVSPEEIRGLEQVAKRWREGKEGLDALEKVIQMHLGLILFIMKQVQMRVHEDPDDLFQAGILGLVYAVDNNNPDFGNQFSTYATPCIEGFMRRVTRDKRPHLPIHVPAHVATERVRVMRAEKSLKTQFPDRKIEDEEIRQTLTQQGIEAGGNLQRFDSFLRRLLYTYEVVEPEMLDADAKMHGIDLRGMGLFDEADTTRLDRQQLQKVVGELAQTLTPREERVLRLYFGIGEKEGSIAQKVYAATMSDPRVRPYDLTPDSLRVILSEHTLADVTQVGVRTARFPVFSGRDTTEQMAIVRQILAVYSEYLNKERTPEYSGEQTLEEIAQDYGVTRERIRQIITKALLKMKHPSRASRLKPFLQ